MAPEPFLYRLNSYSVSGYVLQGKITFLGFLSSKEKKKVNCKPKNQDEQEIPFRLREIMRSRQEMKKTLSNKKRKKEGMYSHHSFVCLYPDAQILRGV